MYDVKYIFKIKNNEGIYCNLAMGYFTHKLANQYLIEKNRELQRIFKFELFIKNINIYYG